MAWCESAGCMHIIGLTKDDVQTDLLFVSGRFHTNRLHRNISAIVQSCDFSFNRIIFELYMLKY